jgi:protocatechuate 3,4-dioxygenase beta subunit
MPSRTNSARVIQNPPVRVLTRRQTLGFLGAAGAAALLGSGKRTRSWAISCPTSPAETEGPYFVDELLERSDITVDPSDGSVVTGVPLRLKINVLRTDSSCAPAAGVRVDVWHANAAGRYSDEANNNTVGKKFLRGYQITDDAGAVEFTTIYPGWYAGRTIHIHFKVRTFTGSQTTYEFTSQLYFDDAISDQISARAPYNSRGTRDTTNATDGIFAGTSALLLGLTADGNGGYVGTFDAGLAGLPATTGESSGKCTDLADCRAAIAGALPDPTTATNARSRRVARRLARLNDRVNTALDRAETVSGLRRARLRRKARAALRKLVTAGSNADGKGTLDVLLTPLEQAVNALIGLLQAE